MSIWIQHIMLTVLQQRSFHNTALAILPSTMLRLCPMQEMKSRTYYLSNGIGPVAGKLVTRCAEPYAEADLVSVQLDIEARHTAFPKNGLLQVGYCASQSVHCSVACGEHFGQCQIFITCVAPSLCKQSLRLGCGC